MTIWHNGKVISEAAARTSPLSAGNLLGWGVFTTLGIYAGRPFALERHLARLRRDAATLEIPLERADAEIAAGLEAVLRANGIADGTARLTATRRGDGRWNSDAGGDLLILAQPLSTPRHEEEPLCLTLSPFRLDARRPLAGIKSTSYAGHARIWREARERGFDEAVVCNGQGVVCECARANLFWARDGVLHTPALQTGCLPGIAREIVLEWCARDGIETRQGAFSLLDLINADELFLTAATTGPRAVAALRENDAEEHTLTAPGPLTQRYREEWRRAAGGER